MRTHPPRRLLGPVLSLALAIVGCSEGSTAPEDLVPTSIQISPSTLSFAAFGDTVRLSATVRDQNGGALTTVPVTWSTSSGTVASVSTSGLVTSLGNGNANVTAAAGGVTASVSVGVTQVAARLRFAPDPVALPSVGDTVTVAATVVDANDNPMTTQGVAWTSVDPDVVEVGPTGRVVATGEGATRVEATVGGLTSGLAAFVGEAQMVITSVSPDPWVEGGSATIRGLGFSPDPAGNVVTLDGIDAVVTAASSVELRIVVPDADCRPARDGAVRVAAGPLSATVEAPVRPAVLHDLEIGEGLYTLDGCLHLAGGAVGARYMVGMLSASEVASSLTPVRLAARAESPGLLTAPSRVTTADGARVGTTWDGVRTFSAPRPVEGGAAAGTPPAPMRAVAGTAALAVPRIERDGEARIREAERDWLESLGPLRPRAGRSSGPSGAPLAAPPVVNDTVDITVPESCTEGADIRAVVRYVGQSAAFLEDVGNPAGGFTQQEYAALDAELRTRTLPIIQAFFGPMGDVDDNDRALVVLTKEVNARENLAGFVFSGDLVSLLEGATCATSNNAEIFYGLAPDPAGVHGRARPKADLLLQYPPLIAHELTHVLQFTALFTTPTAAVRTSWELEGGATLAEQLVGYDVFDHLPRQNLGYLEWREGATSGDATPDWYRDWVTDLALYFGFKGTGNPRAARAPEECSWAGRESEGNTGPCENGRAVYGVPSTLLRFVLDLYGPQYQTSTLLGDAQLMRTLTRSQYRGLEALERATGVDRTELLVSFAAALWADDRPGMGDWIPSWDVYEIFQNVVTEASLVPYTSSAAEPLLDVSVRAASSAYLEWTPPLLHEPTSLRIRSPSDGGALPEHMVLWVLRVQ